MPAEVLVGGGGVHNKDLMQRLARHLPSQALDSTAKWGVDPDWINAMTFTWLTKLRLQGIAGIQPTVTGANQPVVLGGIDSPR